jgi:hypothetical protein
MATSRDRLFTAPLFLGTAFLLFIVALLEKVLNLFGVGIPVVDVYPRQILEWAVILLMFEIALTLRQGIELFQTREGDAAGKVVGSGRGLH